MGRQFIVGSFFCGSRYIITQDCIPYDNPPTQAVKAASASDCAEACKKLVFSSYPQLHDHVCH